VSGSVTRPFSDGGSFVANASYDYQKVTFPSEAPLSDRTSIAAGADQNLTAKTVVIVRSMYLRDQQLLINSRFEQLAGYGLHLNNSDRSIDFELVPGVSVYNQDLGYPADEGWEQGFGFFQKFAAKVNTAWSIGNSFRFRRNFGEPHKSIESAANLTGMITRTVGVQFNYQYNYESQVPPSFPNYLSILSAGLHFEF
jgi:putative salt-induced outer membrane protein YdiY